MEKTTASEETLAVCVFGSQNVRRMIMHPIPDDRETMLRTCQFVKISLEVFKFLP